MLGANKCFKIEIVMAWKVADSWTQFSSTLGLNMKGSLACPFHAQKMMWMFQEASDIQNFFWVQLAFKNWAVERLCPNSFKNSNNSMMIFMFMSSFLGGLRKPTEVRRLGQELKANRYVSNHLPRPQSGDLCTMLYDPIMQCELTVFMRNFIFLGCLASDA